MKDEPLKIPATVSMGPFEVSTIAFGCMRFDGAALDQIEALLRGTLDLGVNLFDTAPIYGHDTVGYGDAEARMGQVLARAPELRDRMVLVTKAGITIETVDGQTRGLPYDSSGSTIVETCEASLRRLQTDRIDVFLIHRPDLLGDYGEIAEALTTLRDAGKILHAGVSNFSPFQLRALQSKLDFPLVASQPEFSLLYPDPLFDGVLDSSQEFNLATMAHSPLGGGQLATGVATPEHRERMDRLRPVLEAMSEKHGTDNASIALAWVLSHPARLIPIVGSQKLTRVEEAVKARDIRLTRSDWYRLLEASIGAPMP
ncbi:aldo/keto reductase [Pseudoponticoccus marisrubri]|nr:aldo/keto reductase [Pseudoponticoccus marisrubri]